MTTESVPKATKSSLCEECNARGALYQCPCCRIKTCSLACCKSHKQRTKCSGKRNRTSFLPLSNMSDETIQSDYHFLEDVLQTVDGGKRLLKHVGAASTTLQQQKPKPHYNNEDSDDDGVSEVHPMLQITEEEDDDDQEPQPAKRPRTSNKWQRLVDQAKLRGTTLMLMPPGMKRHDNNTSWHQHKTNTIHWKVDFNIAATTGNTTMITIAKLDENTVLAEALKKIYPEFSEEHHLLLKRLPCPSNKPMYVEIDRDATLKNALGDQTVIEHPTIQVVPTELLSKFPRTIEEI